MFVNYTIDKNGRLENVTLYPLDMSKPILELPEDFNMKNIRDYVLQDGALICDPYVHIPSAAEQIATLKQKLSETDYVASKVIDEIVIADGVTSLLAALKAIRTEYADVLTQRRAWRKEITDLEENSGEK